jgi:serine/threonine protein kinase
MATLTGRTLGGFLIEEELGRGAMGVVFKAKQLSMDRHVALKFLPKRLAQDEKTVQRFLREARAAGQLSHPNVVGVHDAGVVDGFHYIAMEYVDGTTVHKATKDRGSFSEKEALEIGEQVAEALKYAHGRGILHRDIKPDNFLMDTSGRVRLADLGLARFQNKNDAELTQDGEAMGTPHYMSPEQCRGADVDARSDIYSLGASMFVIASGQTPYDAATAAAVMVKVLTEPPRSLKKLNPALSPGFVALVEKTMHKDPARRFPDAAHLIEAIQKVKSGTYKGVTAGLPRVGTGPAAPVAVPANKAKLMMVGAAAAVVLIAAVALLRPKPTAPVAPLANTAQPGTPGAPSTVQLNKPESSSPASVQLNKNETPKTETPSAPSSQTPSALANNDNIADMKPEHLKAVKALSMLKQDLEEKLQSNPDHVIEQLQNFAKMHPNPRIADNALNSPLMKRAKEAKEKLEKDWTVAKDTAEQEVAEGHKDKAFRALWKFVEAHEDTKQAAEATGMMRGMLGDIRRAAAVAAEKGEYVRAAQILAGPANKLPADVGDVLKKDLEKVLIDFKRVQDFAEADNKHIAGLYERANANATGTDTGGHRYAFEEAAKFIRDGVGQLQTEPGRKEAKALADVYTKAADMMAQMQSKVNSLKTVELQGLGKYPAGQLTAWTDKELTYKPTNPPGLPPQPVPMKLVTPENLIQIAQALGISSKDAPGDHFGLGALSFAAGAKDIAAEHLPKAEGSEKVLADAAMRFVKPATAPASKNDLAKQLFGDALEAKAKKDMDTALKLQQRLIVELADTEFVQSNIKQIHQIGLPGGSDTAVAHNPPKTPEKTPDTKPDPKKDSAPEKTDPLVIAELKKLGWADVKGDWTQDKSRRNIFSVTNGGTLSVPLVDGGAQVQFQLDEGASLAIYVRHEPVESVPKTTRDNLEEYEFVLGPGYGASVESNSATIYGDFGPSVFSPGTSRAKLAKLPLPMRTDKKDLKPGLHSLQVVARGEKLEIQLDTKVVSRSSDNLRQTGNVVLVVEGSAKLDQPAAVK